MKNLTSRADNIRTRLATYCISGMGIAASPMESDVWIETGAAKDLGPHARFGLGWAVALDEEVPWTIPFCSELIDQVTAELSDEDFDVYLGAVEFLIAAQIGYRCDGLTSEDATRAAESDLFETGPGSIALLTDTDLRALDRGLGC